MYHKAARAALECLERGHHPVPLQPRTKIPPKRFQLKRWLSKPPTEAAIVRAFRERECNVAVALGDPSGGLGVRDFDNRNAYENWATSYPSLARTLPTVETPRGAHVYFLATPKEVSNYVARGGSIACLGDGELRYGGYVVGPPSRHPSGGRYRWVSPPAHFPFVGDLLDAGLVPQNRCRFQGVDTRHVNALNQAEGTCWARLTIDQAVHCTQPTGPGQRHSCLFDLIRHLRAIRDLAGLDAKEVRPIVERWHRLAKSRIGTKEFDVTWREFLSGWDAVRCPYGTHLLAIAEQAAGEGIHRLADLCRLLQIEAGDQPFYLASRAAAEVLHVSKSSVANWLRRLGAAGTIRLVTPANYARHRAAEFLYLRSFADAVAPSFRRCV